MIRNGFICALFVSFIAQAAPPYFRPAGMADLAEPLIVTGYRALFTCSAHFVAGRQLADIVQALR